jgi:translation initiation factor 4G
MPQTPNRPRPTNIRLEFQDPHKARLAEEDKKQQEGPPAKAGTEEKVRKEKEEAGWPVKEKKEKALKEKAFSGKTHSSKPFGMGQGHSNTSGTWRRNEEHSTRSNKEGFSGRMIHHHPKVQVRNVNFPEMVDHNVKALLNNLTMEKFDSISDKLIRWANKSETEKDGRTLIQVIRLVYEKATDEAASCEMYARLCRKMMEQISPKVQDFDIKNTEGKPIAGGQLFRKYLLNRCQEDFECGFVSTASQSVEDEDAVVLNTRLRSNEDGKDSDNEVDLPNYADKDYAAQKAKRRGLVLIKFLGELFKLQMLTERIMHECVKALLSNVDHPKDDVIESVCVLLTTVGGFLDTPKARAHLDMYFSRMKDLAENPNITSRIQYMLIDLIELRQRKWVSRSAAAAPTTIAQIHENVSVDFE